MSSIDRGKWYQLDPTSYALVKDSYQYVDFTAFEYGQGTGPHMRLFVQCAIRFFHTYLVWCKEEGQQNPYDFFKAFYQGVLDDKTQDLKIRTDNGSRTPPADAEITDGERLSGEESEHESEEL